MNDLLTDAWNIMRGASAIDKVVLARTLMPHYFTGQKISSGKRFGRPVKVRLENLRYWCTRVGHFKVLMPEFEWWMKKYFALNEGDTFLDIGAHVGKYSIFVGRAVGPNGLVVALEPHQENFRILRLNIELNGLDNIVAINCAAWSKNEQLKLYFREGHTAMHSVVKRHGKHLPIEGKMLDDILRELKIPRIDLIKIDVEDAELHVLIGARKSLAYYKPNLVVECRKQNVDGLTRLMSELDYNIVEIKERRLEEAQANSPETFSPYFFCGPN